jgi:hypothetical protein
MDKLVDDLVFIITAPERMCTPNQKPDKCYSPEEKLRLVKNIVETTPVDVNGNCGEPLREACKATYIDIVKYLLSQKPISSFLNPSFADPIENKIADPSKCRNLTLPWACIGTLEDDEGNDLPRYTERVMKTNIYGVTKEVEVPITHSRDEDVLKLVRYLVEEVHLDVTAEDNFSLRQAGIYNYVDTSKYLLSKGASYEQILEDAFCCACTCGYLELAKLIYEWSLNNHKKIECMNPERILRGCTQGCLQIAEWIYGLVLPTPLYDNPKVDFRANNDDIFTRCCNCVNMTEFENLNTIDIENPTEEQKYQAKHEALMGAKWLAQKCDRYVLKYEEFPIGSGNFVVKEHRILPPKKEN